jgi:hypothetical protein
MAFIDPNRPGIDPVEPLPTRRNPASAFDDGPRADDWRADRPRSNGLMLAGCVIVALMIAGLFTFSGKVESGSTANTPPATTSQPTTAPAVSPVAPTTTGQAPAR